jgi:hypothetical protein
MLAIRCEWSGVVDTESPEHHGNIRGRGGHSDRLRTKDRGGSVERLHGGEVDDRDGDRDRGVDGVLLQKWDRGVSNGSSGVFESELIVAIRRHVLGCMLI